MYVLFHLFWRRHRPDELLMDGIAVHAEMRGQGIGTRLLEAVLDFARSHGYNSVRLDVVDTNPGARRLYERMGFVVVRTREYPYLRSLGFSAVTTMVKRLDG